MSTAQTPFSVSAPEGDHQQRHSTAQAQEQGRNPGTAPNANDNDNEHPLDLMSRPNDAHNDHRVPTTGPPEAEAAKRNGRTSDAASSGDDGSDDSSGAGGYPPQKHAGKAGLGPHYYEQHKATVQDKIRGLKEELEGGIRHDERLQQQGHDRITGELKEKKRKEEEENSPFHKRENDRQERPTEKPAAGSEHKDKDKEQVAKE